MLWMYSQYFCMNTVCIVISFTPLAIGKVQGSYFSERIKFC